MQLRSLPAILVQDVALRLATFDRQGAEGVVVGSAELVQPLGEIGAVPEALTGLGLLALGALVQHLPEDDDPGGQRHGQQHQGDGTGDGVALRPDVGQARACERSVHEKF